ncbi:hypothetical protein RhiirC2_870225 [Rhizophagus irregularis]|uniref:Uncharacterized protein n=1 Tax=Rhizophagus irregularis TaxID=588596 RepID=A0A2N1ML65_9GLOM|nr:hypothetical protein RhiirC2_870225 [Rhizophagus irregularis]
MPSTNTSSVAPIATTTSVAPVATTTSVAPVATTTTTPELTEELSEFRDSLLETLMYYNRITSHEDKVAYLESLRTTARATSTISSVAPVTTVTVTPELTEELRTFRDSLAPETLMYYNCITSHEGKVAYLKSLRATVRATSTISSVAPVTTVTVTPELTEELRTFRDSLAPETLMYYNCITSHEGKVAYLKSLRATVRATSTISSVAPVTTVTVTPELTEELRTFRDSLAPETLMYYNCITSHEGKVAYLESLRATVRTTMKREHEKGLLRFLNFFNRKPSSNYLLI